MALKYIETSVLIKGGVGFKNGANTISLVPVATAVTSVISVPNRNGTMALAEDIELSQKWQSYGESYMDNYRDKVLDMGATYWSNIGGFVVGRIKQDEIEAKLLMLPVASSPGTLYTTFPEGIVDFTVVRNSVVMYKGDTYDIDEPVINGEELVVSVDDVITCAVPENVTSIIETVDGIERSPITIIPAIYQLPVGIITSILMKGISEETTENQ